MGSKTDACEADILRMLTGQATSIFTTTPLTLYIALFTTTPTDSSGGTEVSGGSYARVAVGTKFGAPSGTTQVANDEVVTFPTATASWGTVTGFGIMTASSGGTLLVWGALGTNKAVGIGDTPSFAIGALVLTED